MGCEVNKSVPITLIGPALKFNIVKDDKDVSFINSDRLQIRKLERRFTRRLPKSLIAKT